MVAVIETWPDGLPETNPSRRSFIRPWERGEVASYRAESVLYTQAGTGQFVRIAYYHSGRKSLQGSSTHSFIGFFNWVDSHAEMSFRCGRKYH